MFNTFVIRIWREEQVTDPARRGYRPPAWRVRLQNLTTGEESYFQEITALAAYLEAQTSGSATNEGKENDAI